MKQRNQDETHNYHGALKPIAMMIHFKILRCICECLTFCRCNSVLMLEFERTKNSDRWLRLKLYSHLHSPLTGAQSGRRGISVILLHITNQLIATNSRRNESWLVNMNVIVAFACIPLSQVVCYNLAGESLLDACSILQWSASLQRNENNNEYVNCWIVTKLVLCSCSMCRNGTRLTPQSRSTQKLKSLKLFHIFHKWIEIYSLAIK